MFDSSYLMDTQDVSYYPIVEYVCRYIVMYVYNPMLCVFIVNVKYSTMSLDTHIHCAHV